MSEVLRAASSPARSVKGIRLCPSELIPLKPVPTLCVLALRGGALSSPMKTWQDGGEEGRRGREVSGGRQCVAVGC